MSPLSPPPSDPALALRWLTHARRGALAIQLLLMVAAEWGTDLHVHSPALLAALGALLVVDLAEALWTRARPPGAWLVPAHGAVDLVAITAILALSGGPSNPLMSAYLVYLALLAVVLPASRAWAFAVAAMLLQALIVVWHPGHLPGQELESLPRAHLLGHIVAFDVAAVAITWIVNRLSGTLREREAAELEAQRRRATTDRLAALGTLAAGVAHELGTPLGTIQLLAEEARRETPDERFSLLVAQVDRCRSILERLRVSGGDGPQDCVPDVATWVAEWRRAAPEVAVEVRVPASPPRVAGAEASWRGAVWVALDNARRAGARRVEVESRDDAGVIELRIRDDGAGLDPESAARTGEPFRTGWGGTGLGLFVARSFAQSVGGDVALAPGPGGGALATIRMPRSPS